MEKRRIGPEIRRLNNLIKRELDSHAIKEQLDSMTGLHGWVIGHIAKSEAPIYQRDLEKRFSVRRSTMSNIISLMEKNGLIVRVPSKQDARLKELVLTEKARELDRIVRQDLEQFDKRLCDGISEEEKAAFLATLDKLKANLEKEKQNA